MCVCVCVCVCARICIFAMHPHTSTISCSQACRSVGVECIVAPYEADAQLAFLSKSGIADVVITEDSDLLVFGCKKV